MRISVRPADEGSVAWSFAAQAAGTSFKPMLSWIVVACVVIGVALGATAMGVTVIRLRHELRGMNRRCEKAEREVSSLRDMKLKDVG